MRIFTGILTHNAFFYERERLLERAYQSLKTAFGVEPLLLDNGSQDETTDWCRDKPQHVIYNPPDHDTSPGRGMGRLISELHARCNPEDLIVVSDDDMLWHPWAGERLRQFWEEDPSDVGILGAYLEPVWQWNTPLDLIEHGGVKAVWRLSAPAAAWSFPAKRYLEAFGPLQDGWEFDTAVCRELNEKGMKIAQCNLALHQGWALSSQQNRAVESASPLGEEWNVDTSPKPGKEMNIWYAIPSASKERAEACFKQWKEQGFKCAVLIDPDAEAPEGADLVLVCDKYEGYFTSVNQLCREIDALGKADIIVTGGDDMFPDPKHTAAEIAEQFYGRFPDGFGVMQPTGDGLTGTASICGSPWLGRGWLDKAYQGNGPFHPGYIAFFGDEELKVVSENLGVLWQRPDLSQLHEHYSRPGGPPMEPYQRENQKYWQPDMTLFNERKANKFPGSEPLL